MFVYLAYLQKQYKYIYHPDMQRQRTWNEWLKRALILWNLIPVPASPPPPLPPSRPSSLNAFSYPPTPRPPSLLIPTTSLFADP